MSRHHEASQIEAIRAASRTMVRELGFMRATLAGTDYSPSAVHALLEADARGAVTAAQLVQFLGLEKSSVSRMVAKLVEAGELEEAVGDADGRIKQLTLSKQGKRTVGEIHAYGKSRVSKALSHLSPAQRQSVTQGLAAYAQALEACRLGGPSLATNEIKIERGYRPGLIGRVAEMHADYYSRHYDFGVYFESRVASDLAEFSRRLEHPQNAIWAATLHGRIVGSVAIDGQDLGEGQAHLRWFILDEGCRGSGVGRQLLEQALAFCDQHGFAKTQLWTFKSLDAARRLYEAAGFELVLEEEGSQWGSLVTEQQFTRQRPIAA